MHGDFKAFEICKSAYIYIYIELADSTFSSHFYVGAFSFLMKTQNVYNIVVKLCVYNSQTATGITEN